MNWKALSLPFGLLTLVLASCGSQVAAPQTDAPAALQAQAVTGAFTSAIYSAPTNSCLDVPGGSTSVNQPVLGYGCTGAAEQSFIFTPAAGPANTYTLQNAASKLCMSQYKLGVRQSSCPTGGTSNSGKWTLRPVNAATHDYLLEPTAYTDPAFSQPAYQRCVAVNPAGSTSAHPTLSLGSYCNAASAAQVFRISGTP